MPSYRFPILIWRHFAGGYTACLVENDQNVAAIGATKSAAVGQIKELLQWKYRQHPWMTKPDFIDPELVWMKVEVRPEFRAERRISASKETLPLRVPCVRGSNSAGLLLCALPTIGLRFDYDEAKALPGLVAHYVQTALKGLSPRELARHLPPVEMELDDVVILVPASRVQREAPPALEELSAVAEPIGSRAARGQLSRPWQREEQVSRLVHILATERSSIMLLGESGAGKTAVLMEAVRKAEQLPPPPEPARGGARNRKPQEPENPLRNRFWLTSASRLIAGMRYLGQWQQRCENIIAELSEIDGVLCVENLLDLVRTGGCGPDDGIAAFLVPFIQRGELRLIGEATAAELDSCRRLLPAFAALFQVLPVPPFSMQQAVSALEQLAGTLHQNLKVGYDRLVIEQIHRLFARFMPYHSFPGRAAKFTADLFDRVSRAKKAMLCSKDVIDRFTALSGLPELFLRDDLILKHQDVVDELRLSVVGQDRACETAAAVITTFTAGLNDPNRPIGVLLFCGPTGVGKTELARTISEFLFGRGEQKDRLVRLDMSEYSGSGAAERLLGPTDGEPSELIKRLRQQPFAVVLLDEIEKAAAEVFDVLLGVFDEGRLTDAYGRLTTFRSAIIIMTSNLGADRMQPFGLSRHPGGSYDSEAAAFFRPEFFNRIDAVVTFDPLGKDAIREIAVMELNRIAKREGLERAGIRLRWSERIVQMICDEGFDARYGARPLQRTIETRIVTPLARHLVAHPGLSSATLRLDLADDGRVVFD